MWLHIARESTDRWHHQQQIRQATGTKLLTGKEMFAPVLATFARAFPRTYEGVSASDGCTVKVAILGDAGTSWHLSSMAVLGRSTKMTSFVVLTQR